MSFIVFCLKNIVSVNYSFLNEIYGFILRK